MISPQYYYPLLDDFDRRFFTKLQIAIKNKYRFVGNRDEKDFFVRSLLCLQVIRNYREPLKIISKQLQPDTEISIINDKIKNLKPTINYSWAVWDRDKQIGKISKKLFKSSLEIVGSEKDFDEFTLRYLVSIWLTAWEGPLYALLLSCQTGQADLKEMIAILKPWDFTEIFSTYLTQINK
ncbi:MAG: hypothetical protein WC570_05420 [Patescibacteria group bacterium]